MEQWMELSQALSFIRDIPDFPEPGILFKDITPLLANGEAFQTVVSALLAEAPSFTCITGIEARGFILGSAMALQSQVGFLPIRKAGKLPHTTISKSYGLEYGSDVIEAHIDAFSQTDSVLVVDDVLATGGTILAALEIIAELGGQISEVVVLFEIAALQGRARIQAKFPDVSIRSLVCA